MDTSTLSPAVADSISKASALSAKVSADTSAAKPAAFDPGPATLGRMDYSDPNNPNGTWVPNGGTLPARTGPAPRINPDTIGVPNTSTITPPSQSSISSYDLSSRDLTDTEKTNIVNGYQSEVQSATDAINKQYDDLVSKQTTQNTADFEKVKALNANTGLMDSGIGSANENNQTTAGNAKVDKINTQRATAISSALSKIAGLQSADLKSAQAQKNSDFSTVDTLTKQSLKDANDSVKMLAGVGVSADSLKTNDPDSYNALLAKYGGDEATMRAAFAFNVPKQSRVTTHQDGNNLYVVTTDGKGNYQTTTVPVPFSTDNYKAPIHDGDNLIFMPKSPVFDPNSPKSEAEQIRDQSIIFPLTPKSATAAANKANAPVVSGSATFPSTDISTAHQTLETSRGSDGYVDTSVYTKLYKNWINQGGTLEGFKKEFPPANYTNPADKTVPVYLLK